MAAQEPDGGPISAAERPCPRSAGQDSVRTCIVTREQRPPEEMIRFALDPEGRVAADLRRKLPGRGAWVTADAACVAKAAASNAFSRAFKRPAEAAPDLAGEVDRLLEAAALQSLSLANKAGLVTAGAAKVEASLARERPAALVHARDGAADGRRKLRQAVIRRWGEAAEQLPWIETFDSRQLDLALGRSNVIHAALKTGPAAAAFVAHCLRLSRYRGAPDPRTDRETDLSPKHVFDGVDRIDAT